ncbi:MAG: PepSY domain-containing protein [Methanobacteriaceae archaeon]|jgi:hypothetical protein
MDLKPGWERKALIILGVITVILTVYAHLPFNGNARAAVINNVSVTEPAPAPAPKLNISNNTTSNNITNVTSYIGNETHGITAEQAKKIASKHGFTTGEPAKGNIMINNTNTAVWIVPLMKGTILSKRIYVNAATGVIIGSEEVRINNQTGIRSWELS